MCPIAVRAFLAVAVVLLGVAAACGSSEEQDNGPPYAERLERAQALAARYPGVTADAPLGEFGLWAGIIVQTRWQDESARDEILLWSLLNQTLSVEPSAYAEELANAPEGSDPVELCAASPYVRSHPTPASAPGPAVDRADVCEAWMSYFVGHEQRLPPATLQRLLWDAHTVALVHGLRAYRDVLDGADTTALERNFWASWLEIVFLLEALNFPTESATSVRASDALMPRCSPLGADGCELTPAALGDSYAFVSALANRPASIERIFELYKLGRLNPAALLTPRDPSLALAVARYLALAPR